MEQAGRAGQRRDKGNIKTDIGVIGMEQILRIEQKQKCNKCGRVLPIQCFYADRKSKYYHARTCKECKSEYMKQYYKRERQRILERVKKYMKGYNDEHFNTFGRERKRGNVGLSKRDYELTSEQLERREQSRKLRKKYGKTSEDARNTRKAENALGILVWYSGNLDDVDSHTYRLMMMQEYQLQKVCAIRGYISRKKELSVNFLFDFDLEEMLRRGLEWNSHKIEKWWDGEIRHWTVNDGIWRK